jgi:hypothetical protein
MISKVKSQGKRTVGLTVVERARRLPTPPLSNLRHRPASLLYNICFLHRLNQAQSPRPTIDVSGLSQNDAADTAATTEFARLANACAQETPVVVHTHLATGEKIRDCCYRFRVAVRAGTDRQDQITQGKPCASL